LICLVIWDLFCAMIFVAKCTSCRGDSVGTDGVHSVSQCDCGVIVVSY
jgi:hypothetical protein